MTRNIPITQTSPIALKQCRVAVFMNYMPPYFVSTWEAVAEKVGSLRIFLSTEMEPNRPWKPFWGSLDVHIQRSLRYAGTHNHPRGFSDRVFVDIPYDTFFSLKTFQPQVLISQDLGMRTLLAQLWRDTHRECRFINYIRVSEFTEQGRGFIREGLRRFLIPRSDAYLVNGPGGTRYVSKYGGSVPDIFPVASVVDVSQFLTIPLDRTAEQTKRLLYIGQLITRKGVAPFMQALGRWARQHSNTQVDFWLVGDGPLRQELESIAMPENVSCTFFGNVGYQELTKYYAQGGIFVFPTLADEWGVVTNEALAAGLPMLASIFGQSAEQLIDDGRNGWLFRPDDEQSICDAIERAMKCDNATLATMRANSRAVGGALTAAFSADQILTAVQHVLTK